MVEVEDHHQDPPQLALSMAHPLPVILNLAMVEVGDHHQDTPHKMITDLL